MGKPGGKATGRKPPGTAISPRNGQRAVLTQVGERFDPPDHVVHERALEAWDCYWDDVVSSMATVADRGLLMRWVDAVNRYYRIVEEADEQPVVYTPSNGQMPNPLYKIALGLGNQIERMEVKLGIGPKNRHTLGIQILQQQGLAEDVRRRSSVPSVDEEDPRL